MVPDNAARAPLSAVVLDAAEVAASAARWREWQLKDAKLSRQTARRMRIVFAGLFAAVGVWLAVQLLAPSLLP